MTFPLRRRSAALTAVVLSATLALAACGSDDDSAATTTANTTTESAADTTGGTTSETRQVEADNGTIEVPADPQRVAAIGNASLPFIDLGGEPVGVTEMAASELSLLPGEQRATFEAATNLGPSGGEVDLEKLASLNPGLILAQMPDTDFEQIEEQLESIAPTVFFGLGADWTTLADGLAEAGNTTDALSQQKAEFEEHVAKIQETYREIIDDTSFVALDRWEVTDPGMFAITHIGCVEIAKDEVGLDFPERTDETAEMQSFEQIGELLKYDVILYPVDAEGEATEPFAPVVETNAWKALPAVDSGHALGVFCPGNNSYGSVLRYLESLEGALATLPSDGGTDGDAAGATRSFEADNGTVEIPVDPQRIVGIGSAQPFLDLGVEPVGLGPKATSSQLEWLSPEAQQANDAAVDVGDPVDYEMIATLEPDLIVVNEPKHVLEGTKYDEARLQSIAPTVYMEVENSRWKTQTERLADALGAVDTFEAAKADYDALIAEIQSEYGDLLDSTTFTFLNRWSSASEAEFAVEYANSYCTAYATDAGLEILPEAPSEELDGPGPSQSIEGLGDVAADVDVLIYPLGADGTVTADFAPVLESNVWQALPQVADGRALGVRCNWGPTYASKVVNLESLKEALATLPEA